MQQDVVSTSPDLPGPSRGISVLRHTPSALASHHLLPRPASIIRHRIRSQCLPCDWISCGAEPKNTPFSSSKSILTSPRGPRAEVMMSSSPAHAGPGALGSLAEECISQSKPRSFYPEKPFSVLNGTAPTLPMEGPPLKLFSSLRIPPEPLLLRGMEGTEVTQLPTVSSASL